jgi:hypothetical protein
LLFRSLLYFGARFIVLPAVLAIERPPAFEALKRSWQLTGQQCFHCIGLAVVLALPLLIAWLAMAITGLMLMARIDFPDSSGRMDPLGFVAIAVGALAVAFIFFWLPVIVASQTAAYMSLSPPDDSAAVG